HQGGAAEIRRGECRTRSRGGLGRAGLACIPDGEAGGHPDGDGDPAQRTDGDHDNSQVRDRGGPEYGTRAEARQELTEKAYGGSTICEVKRVTTLWVGGECSTGIETY